MVVNHQKEYEELLSGIPYKPLTLRDYQQECVQVIMAQPKGARVLVLMATGLGKTGTFTHLPKESGRTLIIASGKEIVLNPLQYYPKDYPVAIEMGPFHAKDDVPDAMVVTASIQTIAQPQRLRAFDRGEFQTIIIDEAHHSTAETYKRVIDYFQPDRLVGFTATSDRADGARLDTIYQKVVFQRDLRWAIKNGRLTDIQLRKVKAEFDLRNVRAKKVSGASVADFSDADLARAMANTAPMIARVYREYAFGPTIINVAGVAIAHEVADEIPNSIAITGDMTTAERQKVLLAFLNGEVNCLVNVGVLKEGVDLPAVNTVIMARPTLSSLLYTQLIGRGLRPYDGKDYLNLIELEGIIGDNVTLCSAPILFGIDIGQIPAKQREKFNGRKLTEMEEIARGIFEAPENWALSTRNAQMWADSEGYDTSGVCWMVFPDGHFELSFPGRSTGRGAAPQYRLSMTAPDIFDRVIIGNVRFPLQVALDLCRLHLEEKYKKQDFFWDNTAMLKKWGTRAPSEKQKAFLKRFMPELNADGMSSAQASMVIAKYQRVQNPEQEVIPIYPIPAENPPKHYSSAEKVRVGGGTVTIYDYALPPTHGYREEADRGEIFTNLALWLTQAIIQAYYIKICNRNLGALIETLNQKPRRDIARGFLRGSQGRRYRYLRKLDGVVVSRLELLTFLAEQTDYLIPAIVEHGVIGNDTDVRHILEEKADLDKEPISRLHLEYPGTEKRIRNAGAQGKTMSATISEIKEADKERWLAKQSGQESRRKTNRKRHTRKK